MNINTEEKTVAVALVVSLVVMAVGWGNPVALLLAWGLMIPVGVWYGIRKAKAWNVKHDYA